MDLIVPVEFINQNHQNDDVHQLAIRITLFQMELVSTLSIDCTDIVLLDIMHARYTLNMYVQFLLPSLPSQVEPVSTLSIQWEDKVLLNAK